MPLLRRLIIDSFNVLHVTGALDPERAGPDLAGLAELIASSRWGRIRSTLVCDGPGANVRMKQPGMVEIVFAGPGRDADTLIETILARSSAPRSITVVSSDRRLQRSARRRRARWMASDDFLRRLNVDAGGTTRHGATPTRPGGPIGSDDVQRWIDRFGIGAKDPLRRLPSAKGLDGSPAGSSSTPEAASDRTGGAGADVKPDPLIEGALQEWRGRLTLDDLDMRRWIQDAEPLDDDEDV